MALFDDRKKVQENKFVHDQGLRFKITARRNKLLGLWLAGEMGKTGESAEAYAREVIEADFERPGTMMSSRRRWRIFARPVSTSTSTSSGRAWRLWKRKPKVR